MTRERPIGSIKDAPERIAVMMWRRIRHSCKIAEFLAFVDDGMVFVTPRDSQTGTTIETEHGDKIFCIYNREIRVSDIADDVAYVRGEIHEHP